MTAGTPQQAHPCMLDVELRHKLKLSGFIVSEWQLLGCHLQVCQCSVLPLLQGIRTRVLHVCSAWRKAMPTRVLCLLCTRSRTCVYVVCLLCTTCLQVTYPVLARDFSPAFVHFFLDWILKVANTPLPKSQPEGAGRKSRHSPPTPAQ